MVEIARLKSEHIVTVSKDNVRVCKTLAAVGFEPSPPRRLVSLDQRLRPLGHATYDLDSASYIVFKHREEEGKLLLVFV